MPPIYRGMDEGGSEEDSLAADFQLFRKQHPPAGSRPGTLMVPEGAVAPRIHVIEYNHEAVVDERDIHRVSDLSESLDKDTTTWIDVQGLGDEDLLWELAALFSIHPLALEDVVHVPQRPKTEPYEKHQFFVARMARMVDGDLDVEQFAIFFGEGYVLTFQEHYGDVLDPVRTRLRRGGGPIREYGSDYLAYAILDTVIDGYFPVLEAIGDTIEDLEIEVVECPSGAVIQRVNETKRDLLILRRSVWPMRDAVSMLMREHTPFVSERVHTYLRDSYDHCVQLADVVETYRDLAAGLMNTYLSIISNRTNEVMKVLTVMASIFIPLTFLAGLEGMNFRFMPELNVWWAYPAMLIVMAAVAIGMLGYFRKLGWIGNRDKDRLE